MGIGTRAYYFYIARGRRDNITMKLIFDSRPSAIIVAVFNLLGIVMAFTFFGWELGLILILISIRAE